MLNLATILRTSAAKRPDHTALILGEAKISYGQLHGLVQRFAGALEKLGIKQGQHVALMLPNVPQFVIAYYGAHYAGAPVVPLNVLLTGEEVAYHLENSDAVAVIAWEGFYPHAKAGFDRVPGCKHFIVVKANPTDVSAAEGEHNMAALIHAAEPLRDMRATSSDDTAVILYTSGTTGRPKGAELTHFSMFYNAEYAGTKLLPKHEGTALCTLPLFHSFGQTCVQNAQLLNGNTLVLLPKFDPDTAFKLLHAHKITMFSGVPTMYFALLNHPEADKYDLSNLKYCMSGGSAMPVEVMRAFEQKYKVEVLEGYGLSETSPVASFNVLDRPNKPGSIGLPLEHVEFKLVDDDDKEITESDKPGEIVIKGVNVMKGYYKNPEATAKSIKDGWFYTGDVGQRDDEGYYFIVDRKKDMIIRGGFNVYPREIEETLYKHPAVLEAAVVGVAHPKHGEEVKAIVALKPGSNVSEEDIITYCKEYLAAYKYPRIVEFRQELPKGPTGKILKRELRS
ncbi:MAG: long-chain fatty acid--CoA ligase [Polyangiales bacterium]